MIANMNLIFVFNFEMLVFIVSVTTH